MKTFVTDEMILTRDIPTTAGSKMLDGYVSLFEAEVLTRLNAAGYTFTKKCDVGEFAIDLLGETSYNGAKYTDGKLTNKSAEAILNGDADAAVCLDVNGYVRRAAAQSNLVSIKPTYGTVSRYGIIPVACSGDTISVMAKCPDLCREMLTVMSGHDNKDGTSHSDEVCAQINNAKPIRKVALLKSMTEGADTEVIEKLNAFAESLKNSGIEVIEVDDEIICQAKIAWNVLMSAELCNNVSRYDGVKYGYRAENFSGIDELYTNSRTETFGELLKTTILYGSEALSTDNYMKVYDKSLRTRRVIVEAFAKLFSEFDAVLMPAVSTMTYTEKTVSDNKYITFEENFYTAPASITGLPAVVANGVQLVGTAFSELALLDVVKEGK